MPRPPFAVVLALLPLLGCQQPNRAQAPGTRAVVAACRTEVDRQYAAQNRIDLSLEDEKNEPFAAQYVSGLVTRGLSARYARDNALNSCVRDNGGPAKVPDVGEGPTFTPGPQRQQ